MNLEPSSLDRLLRDGEILIIVPPFAAANRPSLAAHLLQSCAGAAGFRVSVLYASLLLAREIGAEAYAAISEAPPHAMIGERFFARSAHGLPPLGEPEGTALTSPRLFAQEQAGVRSLVLDGVDAAHASAGALLTPALDIDIDLLCALEKRAATFADMVAEAIARRPLRVVGATTTFEQTNASLALLGRIKRARPDIITIVGGANCEGEMAEGVASLGSDVDHVFSGESESTFPAFLRALAAGERPGERIVRGVPCLDLDALPTPDFTEYFEQRAALFPFPEALGAVKIPYESSRGCWWGQKHHCTFCGLNGEGMVFREKSPGRVLSDLRALSAAHPTRLFSMTDNIMPRAYFRTLLPLLAAEALPIELFYEQKANLSLDNVLTLKRAGVTAIQPGIEALSTALLRRMDKGVLARQNLALLRYARAAGLKIEWSLLWGFPGDETEAYAETLALLPLLHHLQPPGHLAHLSIERFSPYFRRPKAYGIERLRPHPAYRVAFPAHAAMDKLAYRFVGDYAAGSYRHLDLLLQIREALSAWQARWTPSADPTPTLRLNPLGDYFFVHDTRGLPGTEPGLVLDRAQAAEVLSAAPHVGTAATKLAIEQKLGVLLDGYYVPLATAAPALLLALEREARDARAGAPAGAQAGAPRRLALIPEKETNQ